MGPRLKRFSKLLAVSTGGVLLVVAGLVMLFTPGPGLLAIVAGLAVLATEFAWAADLKERAMEKVTDLRDRARLEHFLAEKDVADPADEVDGPDDPDSGRHRRAA